MKHLALLLFLVCPLAFGIATAEISAEEKEINANFQKAVLACESHDEEAAQKCKSEAREAGLAELAKLKRTLSGQEAEKTVSWIGNNLGSNWTNQFQWKQYLAQRAELSPRMPGRSRLDLQVSLKKAGPLSWLDIGRQWGTVPCLDNGAQKIPFVVEEGFVPDADHSRDVAPDGEKKGPRRALVIRVHGHFVVKEGVSLENFELGEEQVLGVYIDKTEILADALVPAGGASTAGGGK